MSVNPMKCYIFVKPLSQGPQKRCSQPMGMLWCVIFTEPIWTLLLTKVFLGSKISLRKLLFCLLLIAGAVLVIKPPGIFPTPSREKTF